MSCISVSSKPLKKLETLILEQHCSERIIKAGINRALKIPQSELRNVKKKD